MAHETADGNAVSTMDVPSAIEESSDEEVWAEIDHGARLHLGLSGAEFADQYRQGLLEDSYAVARLALLLRFVDDGSVSA